MTKLDKSPGSCYFLIYAKLTQQFLSMYEKRDKRNIDLLIQDHSSSEPTKSCLSLLKYHGFVPKYCDCFVNTALGSLVSKQDIYIKTCEEVRPELTTENMRSKTPFFLAVLVISTIVYIYRFHRGLLDSFSPVVTQSFVLITLWTCISKNIASIAACVQHNAEYLWLDHYGTALCITVYVYHFARDLSDNTAQSYSVSEICSFAILCMFTFTNLHFISESRLHEFFPIAIGVHGTAAVVFIYLLCNPESLDNVPETDSFRNIFAFGMLCISVIFAAIFFSAYLIYMRNAKKQLMGTVTFVFIHMYSLFAPDSLNSIPDTWTVAKLFAFVFALAFAFAFATLYTLIFMLISRREDVYGGPFHQRVDTGYLLFGGVGTATASFLYTCAQAFWGNIAHSHSVGEILLYATICAFHACILIGILFFTNHTITIPLTRVLFRTHDVYRGGETTKQLQQTSEEEANLQMKISSLAAEIRGNYDELRTHQRIVPSEVVRLDNILRRSVRNLQSQFSKWKSLTMDSHRRETEKMKEFHNHTVEQLQKEIKRRVSIFDANDTRGAQKQTHHFEKESVRTNSQKDSKQSQDEVRSTTEYSPGIETAGPCSCDSREAQVGVG